MSDQRQLDERCPQCGGKVYVRTKKETDFGDSQGAVVDVGAPFCLRGHQQEESLG